MISPNQEYGRRGNKIKGFVIHKTEGSFKSGVEWCINPKSQVSYHHIINYNGDDINLVLPENTAWHAGLIRNATSEIVKNGSNPNLYTIGIALTGFAKEKPTQAQISTCAKLIKTYSKYFEIPIDKNTVVPHNAIRADKICPGQNVSMEVLIYLALLPQA